MDSVYELDYDEKNDRKKPISKFRLITEDELYKVDVFVELDKDAEEIWQKYQKIKENKNIDGLQKRREFLKIKKKLL